MVSVRDFVGQNINRHQSNIILVDGYSLIEMIMTILLMSIAIPSIVMMFTGVLTNSHDAEFMTVSSLLATEQIVIILADKAGTGVGYGYASINSGKYANVDPPAPFDDWTRTVAIQIVDAGQPYVIEGDYCYSDPISNSSNSIYSICV
jgi:type II secretory pathway pseudopilin PulG